MTENVTDWLKDRFSVPFMKADRALVIGGKKGSGKTIAANLIAREMGAGRSYFMLSAELMEITRIRDIDKRYLVIVEDVDESHLETVKRLVSSNRIAMEPLGFDPFMSSFNLNFILTTSVVLPESRRLIVTTPMEVMAAIAGFNKVVM